MLFAKEQLQELQRQWQCLSDARMALSMFFADSGQPCALGTDNSEEELLQEQMASLEAYVASLEDQKAASLLDHAEAANNRASLLLAESLSARESWDLRVAQHDARFARALSVCSRDEWDERGNLLNDALHDLPPRPCSPDFNNQQQLGQQEQQLAAAPNSSGQIGGGPVAVRAAIGVLQSSSGHVLQPSQHAGGSSAAAAADKGKQPVGSQAAQSNDCLDCAICFESHPLSSMVAAALPQQLASSSSAGGRCGHYFCQDCMRRYACEQVLARRYPLCCPNPSCQECLAHDDVQQLLQDQPAAQVYEMLVMEQSIDCSRRAYCPYKDCSCLLERPDEDDELAPGGQDAPFECPACRRTFCLSCGITGWHSVRA